LITRSRQRVLWGARRGEEIMRTGGTIGVPAQRPPIRLVSADWSADPPPGAGFLRRKEFLLDRVHTHGLRLLSMWLLLLAVSWAVVAALVWLVVFALGGA
jgi:hypothetical protein